MDTILLILVSLVSLE